MNEIIKEILFSLWLINQGPRHEDVPGRGMHTHHLCTGSAKKHKNTEESYRILTENHRGLTVQGPVKLFWFFLLRITHFPLIWDTSSSVLSAYAQHQKCVRVKTGLRSIPGSVFRQAYYICIYDYLLMYYIYGGVRIAQLV
jgi:hypothetical protein